MTMLSERQQMSYIAAQAADARLNVELETEGMTLNIGPQHAITTAGSLAAVQALITIDLVAIVTGLVGGDDAVSTTRRHAAHFVVDCLAVPKLVYKVFAEHIGAAVAALFTGWGPWNKGLRAARHHEA